MNDVVGSEEEYYQSDELAQSVIDNADYECSSNVMGEFENSQSSTPSALARVCFVTASSLNDEASAPVRTPADTAFVTSDDAASDTGDEGNSDPDPEKESVLSRWVANDLKNILCYDEIGADWYTQQGGLWFVISEKRAMKLIMKHLNFRLPQGYALNKLNNIKSFLQIYLLLERWECNRHLLPMKNGVLNTQTMELSEYGLGSRFNWQLPYAYIPDAKINVIRTWLWNASGKDIEAVNILRAFFKIALVGGELQKFLELVGVGGTGKSTLSRMLTALVGDKNQVTTDLKNLECNRFEAASLYGKRLALINDSSRYCGEVSTLKAITGGDPIRLEKKNIQQSGSFIYKGVVAIVSNEPIQAADYTSGLIRRRIPITFNQKVTDEDKAKWLSVGGIESAMMDELPGLLNWVLSMPDNEVRASIGGINGEMSKAQRLHLVETNKIAAWLDDNTVIDSNESVYIGCSISSLQKTHTESAINSVISEKIYPNYEHWCEESKIHPIALQRFTASLLDVCSQLKIPVNALERTNKGRSIAGLRIRLDSDIKKLTPVTKKLLSDEDDLSSDEAVTKQPLASADVDGSAGLYSNYNNLVF